MAQRDTMIVVVPRIELKKLVNLDKNIFRSVRTCVMISKKNFINFHKFTILMKVTVSKSSETPNCEHYRLFVARRYVRIEHAKCLPVHFCHIYFH